MLLVPEDMQIPAHRLGEVHEGVPLGGDQVPVRDHTGGDAMLPGEEIRKAHVRQLLRRAGGGVAAIRQDSRPGQELRPEADGPHQQPPIQEGTHQRRDGVLLHADGPAGNQQGLVSIGGRHVGNSQVGQIPQAGLGGDGLHILADSHDLPAAGHPQPLQQHGDLKVRHVLIDVDVNPLHDCLLDTKKSVISRAHSASSTPPCQRVMPCSAASPGKSYTLPQQP